VGDRERIAVLEAEVASLKIKLAPKRPPVAPVDDGVKITTIQTYSCAMPTPEQYEKLLEIVARAHPQVVPAFKTDRYGSAEKYRSEFLGEFISCFQRLEGLWRLPGRELGRDRAANWVDETNRMLGIGADVGLSHLMSAAIAWGDVNFSVARWPFDVFAGLSYSSGRDVRRANSAAWRRVLESGQVRPPVEVGPTRMPTPQPSVTFG
jgi:hypothetical protein